jgi:tetratricopeptide (TPR) repeat protein
VALLAWGAPLMAGEYYGELARRALRDRKYEESRDLAARAIGYERRNPNLYFYLGEARHFLTKGIEEPIARAALFEQAVEAYQEGLRLFPRDTRLLLMLGRTLDVAGRFAEAGEVFQRAIVCDPNFGNVYAYYGLHFKLQRRFPEAEYYLRKAANLHEVELSQSALAEIEAIKNSELGKKLLEAVPAAPGAFELPPPADQ